jgi:hypothetical protein
LSCPPGRGASLRFGVDPRRGNGKGAVVSSRPRLWCICQAVLLFAAALFAVGLGGPALAALLTGLVEATLLATLAALTGLVDATLLATLIALLVVATAHAATAAALAAPIIALAGLVDATLLATLPTLLATLTGLVETTLLPALVTLLVVIAAHAATTLAALIVLLLAGLVEAALILLAALSTLAALATLLIRRHRLATFFGPGIIRRHVFNPPKAWRWI